jgi:hypothetical protein
MEDCQHIVRLEGGIFAPADWNGKLTSTLLENLSGILIQTKEHEGNILGRRCGVPWQNATKRK